MKLNALYRTAGLPAALAISLLAHAVILRVLHVPIENRPDERGAYLVTFELEEPEGRERGLRETGAVPQALEAAPVSEKPPPQETTPPSKEAPLPEERRIIEESPFFGAPSQAERRAVSARRERGEPLEETAERDTAKQENEAVVLDNAAQVKEKPDYESTPKSQGGLSSRPETNTEAYDAAVNDELNRRIEKKKVYPPGARRQGVQGTVLCILEVGPSGALLGIEVAKSSGSKVLDSAAIDLLKRVFPIDNPAGKPLTLEKAIRYSLIE